MPTPAENRQAVLDFFKAWEKGRFEDIAAAYRHYLAGDVVYENSGVPPCRNVEESVAFIRSACELPVLDIQTIRVELRNIAAVENVVFTERIDWHYNSEGKPTLVPHLCGVMEFNDERKIRRWADYFDPGPMLEAIT